MRTAEQEAMVPPQAEGMVVVVAAQVVVVGEVVVQAPLAVPASSSSCMGRNMRIAFNLRRILGTLIILSFLILIAEASDNSTVNYNTNSNITAFSTCKKVTNNSGTGLSVYVPTQSSAEWASFYTNPPAGVSVSSCVTAG